MQPQTKAERSEAFSSYIELLKLNVPFAECLSSTLLIFASFKPPLFHHTDPGMFKGTPMSIQSKISKKIIWKIIHLNNN